MKKKKREAKSTVLKCLPFNLFYSYIYIYMYA